MTGLVSIDLRVSLPNGLTVVVLVSHCWRLPYRLAVTFEYL